jgi:prepilin-type processing-associated H-X9-DG protein
MVLGVRERLELAYPCDRGVYHFGRGSDQDLCDFLHFWSKHPGGAHFLFGDGSVRFVTYGADPIMPALATRNAGEAVGVPD